MFHPLLRLRFRRRVGYWPHLRNPRSYNEFTNWRKLYDRANWQGVSDKFAVRAFVKDRLGKKEAEELLLPLLFETKDPREIPFDDLAGQYVIKASHGSGWNLLVENPTAHERKKIIVLMRRWLKQTYNPQDHEWAYSLNQPRIIIERYMAPKHPDQFIELKFHMIRGKCAAVQYVTDLINDPRNTYFNIDWSVAGFHDASRTVIEPLWVPPAFADILRIAEKLTVGIDQLRVDFLIDGDDFRLGELTVYRSSGLKPFADREFDFKLGALWKAGKEDDTRHM